MLECSIITNTKVNHVFHHVGYEPYMCLIMYVFSLQWCMATIYEWIFIVPFLYIYIYTVVLDVYSLQYF